MLKSSSTPRLEMPDAARTWTLRRRDVVVGTLVMLALQGLFFALSSGSSLLVTFVPGALFAWVAFVLLYRARHQLASSSRFLPVYVVTLSIQLLHFAEEYATGFPAAFATLYGGDPYDTTLFVAFNMAAYAVFGVAAVAMERGAGALLVPVLFFLMYGAVGNAIAHTWWSVMLGQYFPGLITAQLYWVAGPWTLDALTGGRWRRQLATVTVLFGVTMLALLTLFADTSGY